MTSTGTVASDTAPASVVIPTIGRELLGACVASVLACKPAPTDVVVVDQSGTSAVSDMARRSGWGDRVRVVADRQRGIARATNLGVATADQPTVWVTHDDCLVAPDWIGTGIDLGRRHPGCMLTGRVLPADGSPYVPSTVTDIEPREWTGETVSGRLYPANMVVDRAAFIEFGGFDERPGLRLAAEDNDLCYRWLVGGRRLRYEPDLVVWHHDWRSPADLVLTHKVYARGQGAFYAKHLVARDWRVLPMLWWDIRHGFATPVRGLLTGSPRWAEPYWEMNVGLLAGMVAAIPEARRFAQRSGVAS